MKMIQDWLNKATDLVKASLFKTRAVKRTLLDLPPGAFERVLHLVKQWETKDCSGEYKRHQIYSQLLKEYPTVKKSTLALAIEVVKCGL